MSIFWGRGPHTPAYGILQGRCPRVPPAYGILVT